MAAPSRLLPNSARSRLHVEIEKAIAWCGDVEIVAASGKFDPADVYWVWEKMETAHNKPEKEVSNAVPRVSGRRR